MICLVLKERPQHIALVFRSQRIKETFIFTLWIMLFAVVSGVWLSEDFLKTCFFGMFFLGLRATLCWTRRDLLLRDRLLLRSKLGLSLTFVFTSSRPPALSNRTHPWPQARLSGHCGECKCVCVLRRLCCPWCVSIRCNWSPQRNWSMPTHTHWAAAGDEPCQVHLSLHFTANGEGGSGVTSTDRNLALPPPLDVLEMGWVSFSCIYLLKIICDHKPLRENWEWSMWLNDTCWDFTTLDFNVAK